MNQPRNTPLPQKVFADIKPIEPPEFNMRREVLMRVQLKPGLYCLVPATLDQKCYGYVRFYYFLEWYPSIFIMSEVE